MAIRKICPECGQQYGTRPAVSRKDRKTEICPDWTGNDRSAMGRV